MPNKKTKISVIIPTYNRRNCIMNAVNSVLTQDDSFFDFEIIVVDDGSTDNTKKLFDGLKNKKIRYFYNKKNSGVNVTRNIGIKKANGELILLLDSDDIISKDAFKIIKDYKLMLKEVNFFGTAEIKTRKKMYSLQKEGYYSYKDWLSGKIKGEFLSLIKRDVFKEDVFDEERFCFESFFWNRVIKKYGVFAVDKVCRLYSFEEENRVSRELIKPEKACKRYNDYTEYIKRFREDYINLRLYKQYADILLKTGVYAMLCRKLKEGRKIVKTSVRYNLKTTSLLILAASYFGNRFLSRLYSYYCSRSRF